MNDDRQEAGTRDDEKPGERENRRPPQAERRPVLITDQYTGYSSRQQDYFPTKLGKGRAFEPWALPGAGLARQVCEDARERGRHSPAHLRVILHTSFSFGGVQEVREL